MRNVRRAPRLHSDLIEAKKAEITHETNPFEPGTRIWRFFNKVREANTELRAPARQEAATMANELNTVGATYLGYFYSKANRAVWPAKAHELVDRVEAEAIIAAERERADAVHKADAKAFLSMNSRYEKAEAENAALTARVNSAEEKVKTLSSLCEEGFNREKALETQLAAARKALEDIAHPKALTSLSRDKARAALEDKP